MTSTPCVPAGTGSLSTGTAHRLLIHRCSDSRYWYAHLVGHTVELITEDDAGYWSREPAGYLNVVQRSDAAVVTVDDRSRTNAGT